MQSRVIIPAVIMAGIVLGGLFWLYSQNQQIFDELRQSRQLLQAQSKKAPVPVIKKDMQTAARLEKLEGSLLKIDGLLQAMQKSQSKLERSIHVGSGEEYIEPDHTEPVLQIDDMLAYAEVNPSAPVKFSDPYVEPSLAPVVPSTPLAERVYDGLYAKIAAEGESQEMTQLLETGLEQLNLTSPELVSGLSFDPPVCSSFRCVSRVDVRSTQFSSAKLEHDPDYVAEDAYYEFIARMQRSVDTSISRPTQISISRSGDQMVLNIFPKPSHSIGRAESN